MNISRLVERFAVLLSSCFYTSYLPAKMVSTFQLKIGKVSLAHEKWTGAGLVGSFWGLLTYLILPEEFAMSIPLLLLGILTAIVFSHIAERSMRSHDDPRIVIDEWIGAWIALSGFPQRLAPQVLLSFIFFRVFDVFKGPWGRSLQRWPGGLGVTLDDVFAGLLANVLTRTYLYVYGLM